jgi:hypothetical protein
MVSVLGNPHASQDGAWFIGALTDGKFPEKVQQCNTQ